MISQKQRQKLIAHSSRVIATYPPASMEVASAHIVLASLEAEPAINLNAVRAEGLEMFARQQRKIAKEVEQIREWEFARHCYISADEATEFAAQLRADAAKDGA